MTDSVAILPARGGSERIPRKNIREFCGRPIIEYSIEAALKSGCFRRVVVSTDDDETLGIARAAGADTYWRSPKYATAHAIMAEAVIEVLRAYSKWGEVFDNGCVIYPAAPFITPERLREGFAKLAEGFDSVCPVWRGSHVERAMVLSDTGTLASRFPEHNNENSNDWPDSYYHAGAWFWFDVTKLILAGTLMPEKTGAVVIDRSEAVDIDTEADWKWAERLYASRNGTSIQAAALRMARRSEVV